MPFTIQPSNPSHRIALANELKKTGVLAFIILLFTGLTSFTSAQIFQGPNNAGVFSNSYLAGSSTIWSNPDQALESDNSYTVISSNLSNSGEYSSYFFATNYGFSIPSGAVIKGILVELERSAISGNITDKRARIIKQGMVQTTDYASPAIWTQTDEVISYGGPNDTWGTTWTAADINESHFGFAFSIQNAGNTTNPGMGHIDHVQITVFFDETPLALSIGTFSATPVENTVSLSWNSFNESGDEKWFVERSADMSGTQVITEISSFGAGSNQYNASDLSPHMGLNYYRLMQVSGNGEVSYSEWTSAVFNGENQNMVVFPNPVTEGTFSIQLPSVSEFNSTLLLSNLEGSVIASWEIPAGQSFLADAGNDLSLAAGIYFLHANLNNKSFVQKIVVK